MNSEWTATNELRWAVPSIYAKNAFHSLQQRWERHDSGKYQSEWRDVPFVVTDDK